MSSGMFLQIGGTLESDFTQPLGMLSDCHKCIQHFLNMLVSTAGHAGDPPLIHEQRGIPDRALRSFRDAAPKHTLDEEQSLFPRGRESRDGLPMKWFDRKNGDELLTAANPEHVRIGGPARGIRVLVLYERTNADDITGPRHDAAGRFRAGIYRQALT